MSDQTGVVAVLAAEIEAAHAWRVHANGQMTRRLQRYYNAEKRLAAALQACKGGA